MTLKAGAWKKSEDHSLAVKTKIGNIFGLLFKYRFMYNYMHN